MVDTAKKAPAKKTTPAKKAAPAAAKPAEKPTEKKAVTPSVKVLPEKPYVGGIVLTQVNPATNNGAGLAPAVITRVWNDEMVNLKVLSDGPDNLWIGSVTFMAKQPDENADPADVDLEAEDETEAKAAHNVTTGRICFWPTKN